MPGSLCRRLHQSGGEERSLEDTSRQRTTTRRGWALRALALVRIAIGLFFANEAISKIRQGWLAGGSAFARSVNGYPTAHSGGFYHRFVADVILPHAALFALLTTLAEWTVAISLTLGILTRAGAALALWLNLNFMLLRGFTAPSSTLDKVFIVAEAAILIAAAGRVWGLDGVLAGKLAEIPVVRRLAGAEKSDS